METGANNRENVIVKEDYPVPVEGYEVEIEITDPNDWEPINKPKKKLKWYQWPLLFIWFTIKFCILLIPLIIFALITWITLGKTGLEMLWSTMKFSLGPGEPEMKKQRLQELKDYYKNARSRN